MTDRRTDFLNQQTLENIQPKYNAVELRIYGHLADILWHHRLPQKGLITVEGKQLKNTLSINSYEYYKSDFQVCSRHEK